VTGLGVLEKRVHEAPEGSDFRHKQAASVNWFACFDPPALRGDTLLSQLTTRRANPCTENIKGCDFHLLCFAFLCGSKWSGAHGRYLTLVNLGLLNKQDLYVILIISRWFIDMGII